MSLTLGQLSMRIVKTPLGAGLDRVLLVGAINDAYEEIGRRHPWMRLYDNDSQLQMVAVYETGTVAVTEGLNTLTLTGGTFTSLMTGRRIRIAAGEAYYSFTFASSSTGTLDRVYEGDTDSAATFQLFQAIYSLPSSCDVVESVKSLYTGPLEFKPQEWLDQWAANRQEIGRPAYWSPFEDASGVQRIEVYPAPEEAEALIFRHTSKFSRLALPSETFLDWVPEGILFANSMKHLGDSSYEKSFESQLADLVRKDNKRRPNAQIRMAPEFTEHRKARVGFDLTEIRKRQM